VHARTKEQDAFLPADRLGDQIDGRDPSRTCVHDGERIWASGPTLLDVECLCLNDDARAALGLLDRHEVVLEAVAEGLGEALDG
jgi:hypothetical protein